MNKNKIRHKILERIREVEDEKQSENIIVSIEDINAAFKRVPHSEIFSQLKYLEAQKEVGGSGTKDRRYIVTQPKGTIALHDRKYIKEYYSRITPKGWSISGTIVVALTILSLIIGVLVAWYQIEPNNKPSEPEVQEVIQG